MATTRNTLPDDAPISVNGLPDRSETLSLLKQGPMTRLTLWKEITNDNNVNGCVKAHYFADDGLLLLDLHHNQRHTPSEDE